MVVLKWDESPFEIDDVVKIKDDKHESSEENEHYEDELKDEVTSLPDTQK